MDNSDDYFDDNFVLNDDDLALLDAEEQKLQITGTNAEANPAQDSQVNKRRKTLHRYEDEEPDITLQRNGTYGLNTDVWAMCEDNSSISPPSHVVHVGNSGM